MLPILIESFESSVFTGWNNAQAPVSHVISTSFLGTSSSVNITLQSISGSAEAMTNEVVAFSPSSSWGGGLGGGSTFISGYSTEFPGIVKIDFDPPIGAFLLMANAMPGDYAPIQIYNKQGVQMGCEMIENADSFNTVGYYGFTTRSDKIASIKITGMLFAFDNIMFSTCPMGTYITGYAGNEAICEGKRKNTSRNYFLISFFRRQRVSGGLLWC